jgi:hypothetical protein
MLILNGFEKSPTRESFTHNSRLLHPQSYFKNLVIGNFYITSDLIPPLTSFFTWSHFESLTLRVIFSNLHGRKNLDLETLGFEDRTVSIQELFPGAHINPSIIDIKLNLTHDCRFFKQNCFFSNVKKNHRKSSISKL